MNAIELIEKIESGETSRVQFKLEMDDDKFAAEMIAMSNSKGGVILVGVEDKTGKIMGLSFEQLQSYNNRLANVANDKVKPQIFIDTEVVTIDEKKILIVTVPEGTNKPYKDKNGAIWIKQGSDKRRVTDNNEQIRLFQQSGSIYVDEMIVPNTSVDDVDFSKVEKYIQSLHKSDIEKNLEINQTLLTNLNIMNGERLTLGGLLFFSYNPQKYRPVFSIKAISFFGNSIGGSEYRNSKDIEGTIPEMFEQAMAFFSSNLHSVQAGQNFNSIGKLEISRIALEEMLQNALLCKGLHNRDYVKSNIMSSFIAS